ncbi:hypothetical protein A1O7_08091 [Cladophialophora yegresii CBS 114405]|uniref:Uncharacterized protein n=1 Tax=Cladophialophora yegresii CBS 114405 TaxID=1182544 RepID=W9VSK3_9EURO|nr:uncharacterized protein A1O7_08091 [Cladophialophora yegresii CBS 114405]EXJ55166.1 hypothetical protein A1O7_08091 [Cladophialophora yegresii CBS 114405]
MPPEIADSDAESDLGSPDKRAHVLGKTSEAVHVPLASPSEVDFDQFLDPTQRLSSSASYQVNNIVQFDGSSDNIVRSGVDGASTDTHLTSLSLHMSPAVKAKKRAHSALQDVTNDASHDSSDKKAKSKRSKTYGAASRSRSALGDDLFAPSLSSLSELKNLGPENTDASAADQRIPGSPSAPAGPSTLAATTSRGQAGVISALGGPVPEAAPIMTTSVASMGQYQSINLDFRGGLDVTANPFGPMSQVSVEGEPNQSGTENRKGLLQAAGEQPPHDYVNPSNLDVPEEQLLPPTSQPFPPPLAMDHAQVIQTADSAPTPDAGIDPQAPEAIAGATDRDTETVLPSTEKPAPKKRGRNAKNSSLSSTLRAPSFGEDVDELALPSMPPPNRPRRSTVDSLSQASETSGPISSTKSRKRGKSKPAVVDDPVEADESSPAKLPANELNLSDEVIIGLPKEAYKPRPSRSRSKIIEEETPPQRSGESSPVKPTSSGPNLSDEAAIGLPKDNYKPRPSRSRSKKVVDEAPSLPPPEEESDHGTPAKSITTSIAEVETPPVASTKSSTKKGRKSKVKRAKTSAAALLKKVEPMLSEGEEDVVWMDTKPAPVKLDLPPDLSALKKEADVPGSHEGEDGSHSHERTTGKDTHITIEIPGPAETKNPAVTEPKKRGRKPKKVQQKTEAKAVEEDEKGTQEDNMKKARPALAEKSSNVCDPGPGPGPDILKSPIGKAAKTTPTVSPFTSPEPEASRPQSKFTVAKKENQPLTTPAKPKSATAPPCSAEKGPAKHSPISSLTSSGRKAIYRVGLSRRQNIPSLLRKVDRDKPPPKNVAIKQKEKKVKVDENHDGEEGGGGRDPSEMRGADGMLIEWEF